MPDDKSITAPSDRKRIDIDDPDEVRNWCKSFGCTPKQLRNAVDAAGSTYAEQVKKHL